MMGEYAEAALWAEMNGRDPSDMSPDDWEDFYADTAPPDALDVAIDAQVLLGSLDDAEEGSRAEALLALFPELGAKQANGLVRLLEVVVSLHQEIDAPDTGEET